jgi:hypothetical protein
MGRRRSAGSSSPSIRLPRAAVTGWQVTKAAEPAGCRRLPQCSSFTGRPQCWAGSPEGPFDVGRPYQHTMLLALLPVPVGPMRGGAFIGTAARHSPHHCQGGPSSVLTTVPCLSFTLLRSSWKLWRRIVYGRSGKSRAQGRARKETTVNPQPAQVAGGQSGPLADRGRPPARLPCF